jgi:hypothetical protein
MVIQSAPAALSPPTGSTAEARAWTTLGPLLAPADGPAAMAGRPYEYLGPRDPLAEEVDRTSRDLEGLRLRDGLAVDVEQALSKVTMGWIERQVEAAILQSTPERQMAEITAASRGGAAAQIITPPAPVAHLRIPAVTLAPLVSAVDADAHRFAVDPAQQEFRARALLRVDARGRAGNATLASKLANEVGEALGLEREGGEGEKQRRRRDELGRDHARRHRYARAFALAARRLGEERWRVDARDLFRAFEAVAGLDKAPFRRGPSEHLTPDLLATMAVEFYRALRDPAYPVSFLLLTFPIKNSSGLRTNTATEAADWGEVLMLAQLRRMLEFLARLGLPNVRFVCLTDGIVYSRYLGPYDRIQAVFYRENVRRFRDALGLAGRVLIVDAENLLLRIPGFDGALHRAHGALERAECLSPAVQRKLTSLIRSFLFHVHTQGEDVELLARIVNASLEGRELESPGERAEQRRIWAKAAADARWYAAHLLVMSALDVVRNLVDVPYIRATVHPKPGQFAPAPVNVRDFTDLPYHRKPVLKAGANPLSLEAYAGVNLWADPALRFVDVYVGQNRSPFLAIRV